MRDPEASQYSFALSKRQRAKLHSNAKKAGMTTPAFVLLRCGVTPEKAKKSK